jgi:hypothetical protein
VLHALYLVVTCTGLWEGENSEPPPPSSADMLMVLSGACRLFTVFFAGLPFSELSCSLICIAFFNLVLYSILFV